MQSISLQLHGIKELPNLTLTVKSCFPKIGFRHENLEDQIMLTEILNQKMIYYFLVLKKYMRKEIH